MTECPGCREGTVNGHLTVMERRDAFDRATIRQAVAESAGDPIPTDAPRWVPTNDLAVGHVVPGMTEEVRRLPAFMVALCGAGPFDSWQHGWAWEGGRLYRPCPACTALMRR